MHTRNHLATKLCAGLPTPHKLNRRSPADVEMWRPSVAIVARSGDRATTCGGRPCHNNVRQESLTYTDNIGNRPVLSPADSHGTPECCSIVRKRFISGVPLG